ncbi:MAG TPA: ribonuclease H-like domain-containing protein [Phycisphaerae bacterium]|nr:ribonuclease H-like domain-containing protein [Phycisphaerae bacterium]
MALSESGKRKIQALMRRAAKLGVTPASQMAQSAGAPAAPPPLEPVELARACVGVEADAGGARFWRICRTLGEVSSADSSLARQYAAVVRGARQRFDELEASAELCRVADGRPEDLLFMDVESCGLVGAVVFLVGLMHYADGQFHFEQYLARDYAEEPGILRAFAERLGAAGVLVTFNGKAFDMNLIRERSAFNLLEPLAACPPHLDLLHEARRRWRRRLPNCKLQTLERHLCGRHRVGDIPGAAIADAYHHYVLTADARRIADIVHHNLMDLLTMAELLCLILTGCEPEG